MIDGSYDAVFVINQDTDIYRLHLMVKKRGFRRILFLTTHYLFDTERDHFAHLFFVPDIVSFAELLSDVEMFSCDERASSELNSRKKLPSAQRSYNENFMRLTLRYKNELVVQKINALCQFTQGFVSPGLGIAPDVWLETGYQLLTPIHDCSHRFISYCANITHHIIWFFKSHDLNLVRHGNELFIFLGSVRRLNLVVAPVVTSYSPWKLLYYGCFSRKSIINKLVNMTRHNDERVTLGVTIHNYAYWMSELAHPIQIYVDGYHPSNYSRSYIDSYPVGEFVVRTMFDAKWFEQYGKEIVKSKPFLETEYFKHVAMPVSPVKTICLLLNHAGDWSALINRSDTDILIQQFVNAARELPHLNFIIRPHPTMIHPSHEGKYSRLRIERFVLQTGLPNLSISHSSLDDDLKNSDLFVAEYSQTLLDVFKAGKIGLIANVTQRRSFMTDFENLGFSRLPKSQTLADTIDNITNNTIQCCTNQNVAVDKYNKLLDEFIQNN